MAIGTGLAIFGGSLIAGALGKKSSDKAAGAAKDANASTIAESRRQFDLVRGDTAGVRNLGNNAIDALSRLYGYAPPQQAAVAPQGAPAGTGNMSSLAARLAGRVLGRDVGQPTTVDNATGQPVAAAPTGPTGMDVFFESPDYQFNLAEGQKAIDRSAASRHGVLSGAAVKEGARYSSGLASREYGSFVDRLMQQAGLGSNGTAASAAAGANSASTIGASNANAANARGSAYMAGGAAINNAVQSGISNYMLSQYLGGGGSPGIAGGTYPAWGS